MYKNKIRKWITDFLRSDIYELILPPLPLDTILNILKQQGFKEDYTIVNDNLPTMFLVADGRELTLETRNTSVFPRIYNTNGKMGTSTDLRDEVLNLLDFYKEVVPDVTGSDFYPVAGETWGDMYIEFVSDNAEIVMFRKISLDEGFCATDWRKNIPETFPEYFTEDCKFIGNKTVTPPVVEAVETINNDPSLPGIVGGQRIVVNTAGVVTLDGIEAGRSFIEPGTQTAPMPDFNGNFIPEVDINTNTWSEAPIIDAFTQARNSVVDTHVVMADRRTRRTSEVEDQPVQTTTNTANEALPEF